MTNKDKKKILYVITKSNWGGAQRYVYDISTNIPKDTFDAKVILGGNGVLRKRLEEKNIPVIQINQLGRDVKFFGDIISFFKLLRIFIREKPDAIHLNSSKIGGLGALAGRIARTDKIIFTAHGWAFNEQRHPVSKLIIKFIQWLTVVLSHKVIVVSQHSYNEIEALPMVQKKLTVIHNGITQTRLKQKQNAREALLGARHKGFENALWLGTIAELHKNKGLEYAISAFSKVFQTHPDILFVIIGKGEEKNNLDKLITAKNLQNNVLFFDSNEANIYLRAFDIFILPSIKEGLPYVILEAGMAKLPIIASGTGGIPEIIDDMQSGILVRPKSTDELTKAIEFLLTNKSKQVEFGKNINLNIEQNFSFQKMLEKTTSVYTEKS